MAEVQKPVTFVLDQTFIEDCWSTWKRKHEKAYDSPLDEERRLKNWMRTLVEIMQHNIRYDIGLVSWFMGLTQFGANYPGEPACGCQMRSCGPNQKHEHNDSDTETKGFVVHADHSITVTLDSEFLNECWTRWKYVYGKQYSSTAEEESRRMKWTANLVEIMKHKVKWDVGLIDWSRQLNEFSDQDQREDFSDSSMNSKSNELAGSSCIKDNGNVDKPFLVALNKTLLDMTWAEWKSRYNKSYATEEEEKRRRECWLSHVIPVMQNQIFNSVRLTKPWLEVTQFSDLSWDEVRDKLSSGWCPTAEEITDLDKTGFGTPFFMNQISHNLKSSLSPTSCQK
ncbi:hypothetical protein FBUS_02736 [Fasciolopsis buskii]|uniref:Cathepsin propeptide inhibitor domain-containing protein n=1 Tax=Fasciolopsis buskii TaxID=27845 RepID=A0A8E0S409_9TREM|nr:hypothetical protein FBUS_02736 [Fasciolopsis buski]